MGIFRRAKHLYNISKNKNEIDILNQKIHTSLITYEKGEKNLAINLADISIYSTYQLRNLLSCDIDNSQFIHTIYIFLFWYTSLIQEIKLKYGLLNTEDKDFEFIKLYKHSAIMVVASTNFEKSFSPRASRSDNETQDYINNAETYYGYYNAHMSDLSDIESIKFEIAITTINVLTSNINIDKEDYYLIYRNFLVLLDITLPKLKKTAEDVLLITLK